MESSFKKTVFLALALQIDTIKYNEFLFDTRHDDRRSQGYIKFDDIQFLSVANFHKNLGEI